MHNIQQVGIICILQGVLHFVSAIGAIRPVVIKTNMGRTVLLTVI